jgi:hypothetical protein
MLPYLEALVGRGVHARHLAVAREARAAQLALQVRARPFRVGIAVPDVDYPERSRRILDPPYVAPGQDTFGSEYRKNVM